jgi:hypothetical protein
MQLPICILMNQKATRHPDEEQIEAYVLGRAGWPKAPEVLRLESHLLSCSQCILIAEEALQFVREVREVLTILELSFRGTI